MAERERTTTRDSGRKTAARKPTANKTSARKTATKKIPAKNAAAKKSSAADIATSAARQLLDLTGKESEGVVSINKDGDSWMVEVEVLELRRIPSTTDVLASYEVTVDTDGDLVGYRRLRRYTRGSAGEQ